MSTSDEVREQIGGLYAYATGLSPWNVEDRKPEFMRVMLNLIDSQVRQGQIEVLEKGIREYHRWLGHNGVNNDDGLPTDFQLADLDVYNGYIEDPENMPFSELVDDFFSEHKEIDEEGQPVSTPFNDLIAELREDKPNQDKEYESDCKEREKAAKLEVLDAIHEARMRPVDGNYNSEQQQSIRILRIMEASDAIRKELEPSTN